MKKLGPGGPRAGAPLLLLAALVSARPAQSETPAEAAEAEVLVTGTPVHPARGPKDDSVAVTVVARKRLSAPGLSAVGALRGTPGLVAHDLGGLGSPATVSLRGATAAQTSVYLAGVRINDSITGAADLARIPVWFLDRIEVYRGNAPVGTSRLDMGGAIFLEPRKPNGTKLELGALAGSFGTVGVQGVVSAGEASNGVIAGVGLGRATNDYAFKNSNGTLWVTSDDSRDERQSIDAEWLDAWLHARRRLGRTELALLANFATLERGVQRNVAIPTRGAREAGERELFSLSTRTPFGERDEWLETSSAALLSKTIYTDPTRGLGLTTPRVELASARVNHRVGLRKRLTQSWLLRSELGFESERLERREIEPDRVSEGPTLVAHDLALRPLLASDLGLPGTPLVLRAVAALECSSGSSVSPALCATREPVGRLGPTLLFKRLTVYANAGRYVRRPTLGERFGVSALLRGTPNLRPERGVNLDLGARYDHPGRLRFWLDVVGYARFAKDGIRYVQSAERYRKPENVDETRYLGLELASGLAPLEWAHVDVALSLLDARDTSPARTLTNDVIPLKPRLSASPTITFELGALDALALDALSWSTRYTYQSSRYNDPAGTQVLPEQGRLESELDATWFGRRLITRFRVENLLGQLNQSDALGLPLPGRSFYVSLEVTH